MAKITVSDYIMQELAKLGIKDVFGLPGDYNFRLIDSIEKNGEINWIGCTNELNAGYAADGYARVNGYGAVLTTFGVGELSAINAVAGSYAEGVPVVKIVGVPPEKYIKSNTLIHHNFMNPDYYAYFRAYENVVEAAAFLSSENAKEEIDRVLSVFVKKKKPVYLAVPMNVCYKQIENNPKIETPESRAEILNGAVNHAVSLINKSESPVIIGGILTKRNRAMREFNVFLEKSKIPSTTLIMGKGLINEACDRFMGTYLGHFENPDTYEMINNSDCVISIGTIYSDFNTLGFDILYKPCDFIQILGDHTIIENKKYENVYMKDVLRLIAEKIEAREFEMDKNQPNLGTAEIKEEKPLDFKYLLPRFQEFLKPKDKLFVETGILEFAGAVFTMPEDAVLYNQFLWGSIGWATPAVHGAGIADKSSSSSLSSGRIVLLTGEGSHQLTAQALSSIMYDELKPVIFVLNNNGYTIERLLSDNPNDEYNDIPKWEYTKLPEVFEGKAWTAKVHTNKEFDEVLNRIEEENKTKMCYIELFTDKCDVPELFKNYIDYKKEINSKYSR